MRLRCYAVNWAASRASASKPPASRNSRAVVVHRKSLTLASYTSLRSLTVSVTVPQLVVGGPQLDLTIKRPPRALAVPATPILRKPGEQVADEQQVLAVEIDRRLHGSATQTGPVVLRA